MSSVSLNGGTLTVSTIYCVGKNYEAHAKEMREKLGLNFAEAPLDEPILFSKPASSLVHSGACISIPQFKGQPISHDMHHELELVVLIGKRAIAISETEAADYVAGFGVGLDMTLRDRQTRAKQNGQPWLVSKGFRTAAAVSEFVAHPLQAVETFKITLQKNGALVQQGYPRKMTFTIPFLISYLSHIFGLEAGDLIFTGTPEGVGKVNSGDTLTATLYGGDRVLTTLQAHVK